MEFRLLGPVEIEAAGQLLPLSRRRERCLLAVLLLNLHRQISVDRLASLLWDGNPPERARPIIHSHISRIRTILNTAHLTSDGIELATIGDCYRIRADPQSVDAHRFGALLDRAAGTTDPAERIDLLRTALDLWRGPALENAASDQLRARLCAGLEERRITASEDLFAAHLALGRARQILPELTRTANTHCDRETLTSLHMRALYQAGRKADALAAYTRARTYLNEQLGLDPSPALRDLHHAILRDELTVPRSPTDRANGARPTPPDPTVVTPRQLPTDIAGFTGRAEALQTLDKLLSGSARAKPTPVGIAAITGTAGVGKTALAVHWAHQMADHFPDGQLYINLRGFEPGQPPMAPAEAVRGLLDTLAIPPHRIPIGLQAQVGLYRSLLADRRMLVVLDNARDSRQVRQLLPGTASCLALVTSRNQLSGLVAAEGADPLTLDLLPHTEAHQLLETRLGVERLAAEPDAAADIITRCARLPLALTIVAARAVTQPSLPLGTLAQDLHQAQPGLHPLSDPDPTLDIRAVFSISYQTLPPDAARLFRLLGLHPGPDISTTAAASMASVSVLQARRLLAALTRAHLIVEEPVGRYHLHDLLRAYAAELAHSHDDGPVATLRMLDFYLHTALTAGTLRQPHREQIALPPPHPDVAAGELHDQAGALAWLDSERPVLRAVVMQAAATGFDTYVWQLAWVLWDFLYRRGHLHDLERIQTTALEAAERLADPLALAYTHRGLARVRAYQDSYEDAHTHLRHALDQFTKLGHRIGQARTHLDHAVTYGRQGRHEQALTHDRQALALCQAERDLVGQAYALNGIGWQHAHLGDHQQTIHYCQQALALQEQLGGQASQSETWDSLGRAHLHLGHHQEAVTCYQHALDLARHYGDRRQEASVLIHLGEAHRAGGNPQRARMAWQQALTILRERDSPEADEVERLLRQLAGDG